MKKKMQIDGLLVIDKPEGITSLEGIREIKRRFHVKKAGHIGTLDPFATGVLPIAINEGTKLIPFLKVEPKEYEAVLKLGEETSTDDLTGEVGFRGRWEEVPLQRIHDAFQNFSGKIQQIPPMFSAIKMKGQPLYRLARKGIEIERHPREVEIHHLQIVKMDLPKIYFRVSCSKGTYIRSLGRDIGRKLGCGAHLLSLRRIRCGPLTIEQALSFEKLKEISEAEQLSDRLISLRKALPGLSEVVGDAQLAKKVRLGKEIVAQDFSSQPLVQKGEWLKMSTPEEGLVAILRSEVKGGERERFKPEEVAFRPLRVFLPNR
jgi:tRNA pseudouridine55 synthase